MNKYTIPFDRVGLADLDKVGGKNASIGEMIGSLARLGVRVPGGFATTSQAYRDFLTQGGLADRIAAALEGLDVDDVKALARAGAQIRRWMLDTPFHAGSFNEQDLDLVTALANYAAVAIERLRYAMKAEYERQILKTFGSEDGKRLSLKHSLEQVPALTYAQTRAS